MKEVNPIATFVPDGGYTCIFRTLGCIGDSLSSGEHESTDENGKKGFHDYYEYSWGQFIARKCGINVTNMSRGGLTCKQFHDMATFNHYFAPENLCQGYIIALGANDMNQLTEEYPFGDMSDVNFENYDDNKRTFVGDYVRIIQRIREAQPKARIFVMTMPVGRKPRDEQGLSDKHAEFLRALPEYFDYLYVIDLRKYAPVYDEEFEKTFFLGGHLSAMGYKFTADMVATYVDYIIRNNVEDFRQVGFIGKGVHNENHKW